MALQTAPLMANARPRIVPNKCIVIKRSLVGEGELNVVKGTEIAPYNILGRSNLSRGYSSVHLAKQLGVSPAEGARYLQKPIGSTIFKGELLASKKGLIFKKNILSPTDGVLDHYDLQSGELRLKFIVKQVPLPAGVFGIVEGVDQASGSVLIKTMATIVYGVIGFGNERGGILQFIGSQTGPLYSSQVISSMHQHVLVSGALIFRDALKKAAGLGIQGVISGGLNLADYRALVGSLDVKKRLETDVGITVLATEGFGPIPMGQDIYQTLKRLEGQFIFIDGNKRRLVLPSDQADSVLALRKISIPSTTLQEQEPEVMLGELEVGSRVRIIWPPLMGVQGKIASIDSTPSRLESGLSTYLVTVESGNRKVKVPFPNIEIII